MLIGDNNEYFFTYLIERDHPSNYYYYTDYMYLCKYTIINQELKEKMLIASTLYEDTDTNGNWIRKDTTGQTVNVGEYLIRNMISYAFPLGYGDDHRLNIDKEGIFIQEGGVKAFVVNAEELEEVVEMSLWGVRIVAVYVSEETLISNPARYYVVVEAGDACCIDTDFASRIVVITKARLRDARRELEVSNES